MKYVHGKKMKTLRDRLTTGVAALALLTNSVGMSLPFVLTQRAAAATLSVCASGCDYTEIQSAIDAAGAGDTITVGDGTYNENIVINKNGITLRSENGAASTTIDPASGRAIEFPASGGVARDGVTIEGFTLEGNAGQITLQVNSDSADGVYNSTNLTYRNLVINANGGFGLGLFDVDGVTIDNVSISGATLGIEAIGVADLTMSNSSVAGSTNTGINIWHTGGYEVNNNLTFTNNTFINNPTGLKFVDTDNVIVSGGTVSGGTNGIVSQGSTTTIDNVSFDNVYPSINAGVAVSGFGGYVQGGAGAGTHAANDLTVRNSTFTNIGRIGILIKGTGSTVLVDNITYTGKGAIDGLDYAVEFGAGATGTVRNSTIANNKATAPSDGSTSAGILATNYYGNGTEATITGNTFTDNSTGIYVGYTSVEDTIAHINQNNFIDNTYGVRALENTNVDATENWWGDKSGPSGQGTGSGDAISANAAFSPWLCQAAPSVLTTTDGVCDDTKPVISINPTAPKTLSGTESFEVTITDDQPLDPAKNKDIWVELYGTPDWSNKKGQKVNLSSGSGLFTIDTTTLPDGKYILRVGSVADAAGNTSGDKTFSIFTIDNTAPAAPTNLHRVLADSTVVPCGSATRPQVVTPTWTASTSTDVAYYEYSTSNPDGSPGFDSKNIGNTTSYNTGGWMPTNGTGTFFLRTVDTAGNMSEWVSCSITYDNSRPTITIDGFDVTGSTLEVNVSGTDTYSGLLALGINIYDATNSGSPLISGLGRIKNNIPMFTFSDNANRAGIDISGLAPGIYTIRAVALDHAGNYSLQDLETFTIEEAAPAPQILSISYMEDDEFDGGPRESGDTTYIRDFIFTLTGNDSVARYQLRYWNDIDGSPFKEASPWNPTDDSWSGHMGPLGTYTDLFTQGFGTHYFSFSACDEAGNCSAYSDPFVITYAEDGGEDVAGCATGEICCDYEANNAVFALVDLQQSQEDCEGESDEDLCALYAAGEYTPANDAAYQELVAKGCIDEEGNVLGDNIGLTNTGTQNSGLIVFIATSLMAIALLSLRRKQEN